MWLLMNDIEEEEYKDINEENNTKKRIFSDCWSAYQVTTLNN